MTYCISDIHGEFGLFVRLLDKIGFSDSDRLLVLGDMIDKGDESVRLLRLLRAMPNAECIIGNHEYGMIKRFLYYKRSGYTEREIVSELQNDFKKTDGALDYELVEWVYSLPSYIEEDDFICVHAGITLGPSFEPYPLSEVPLEQLVYDRSFKERNVVVNGGKCVFFGHTPTWHLCGAPHIIFYPRECVSDAEPKSIKNYYKIHLDTGVYETGVLGIVCVDTCEAFYIAKDGAWKV